MPEPTFSPTALLLIYCLLVFAASMTGGWLPTALRLNHARLQVAISFVSGLMLGLSLLSMLPHALEQLDSVQQGTLWLLAGFLVMFLLQRFLPFHHHDLEETESESHDDHGHEHGHHHTHGHDHSHHGHGVAPLRWMGVAAGLSLHSIFDGLALAAAVMAANYGHNASLGLATALAVILHKPFGAMAITTLMAAGAAPRRWHHLVNASFALVTPLGALLFFLGAKGLAQTEPAWLGAALAFCAGTFLCIACADLLPELQFHTHDRIKLSVALIAGITVALLIGKYGHPEHDHSEGMEHHQPLLIQPLDSSTNR